jgi:hypothetical protein
MVGRLLVVGMCAGMLTGCGVSGGGVNGKSQLYCMIALTVEPPTGSADHRAAAPGNQVKYAAWYGPTQGSSCLIPELDVTNATWTSSDPLDVQVSSAPGDTNGLATCTGATSGAATLTASYTPAAGSAPVSGTATLTCQ